MLKILIVAATPFEIAPFVQYLQGFNSSTLHIETLITGIGGVQTTFELTRTLLLTRYDFVLNAGIAGSFVTELPIGSLAWIQSDEFADLAYEEPEGYETFMQSGFSEPNCFPFVGGKLLPLGTIPAMWKTLFQKLPTARAISVNKVHGQAQSIELAKAKFNPEVESMEGAAFFYVCAQLGVASAQVRSISNFVEVRNRANWDIPQAIKELNHFLSQLVIA